MTVEPSPGAGSAIHIGVDRPDPAHYGELAPLRSAEHDARAMQALTKAQGFEPTVLLSGRAAHLVRVRDEIANAASVLVTGDTLVITFAGYGAMLPGLDRTLCLYDQQLPTSLLYSDLARLMAGVRVVIVEDSCTRVSTEPSGVRALPTDRADAIYAEHRDAYDALAAEAAKRSPSFMVPVLTLHACGPHQQAREGALHGRFTSALLVAWRHGAYLTAPDPSYRDLLDRTVLQIHDPAQVPDLETLFDKDQRIMYRPPFVLGI
jgi:hypothetical protein